MATTLPSARSCGYDGVRGGFAAKERDAETGLDYFNVRYFSGAQGRFTSPDPLLWQDWQHGDKEEQQKFADLIADPQQFNLYAYVRNNPLRYTDPTGTYYCDGNETQCNQIKDAYNQAKAALKSEDLSASQKGEIQKVLKFLGDPGKSNGVIVAFGATPAGSAATTDTKAYSFGATTTTITFNLKALAGFGLNTFSETLIHEGTHGLDDFAKRRNPATAAEELSTERHAYGNESYVTQGLGGTSQLWRPGISEADRRAAIEKAARGSLRIWCSEGGKCK